jgi:hypothetical protein
MVVQSLNRTKHFLLTLAQTRDEVSCHVSGKTVGGSFEDSPDSHPARAFRASEYAFYGTVKPNAQVGRSGVEERFDLPHVRWEKRDVHRHLASRLDLPKKGHALTVARV